MFNLVRCADTIKPRLEAALGGASVLETMVENCEFRGTLRPLSQISMANIESSLAVRRAPVHAAEAPPVPSDGDGAFNFLSAVSCACLRIALDV